MADGGSPNTSSRRPKFTTDEALSVHGTMCDRIALLTHRSVRCRLCKETPGVRVLDAAELADRANRLREANLRIAQAEDDRKADPFDKRARDQLEIAEAAKRRLLEQLGEETTCKPCRGTGYTTPTRSHRSGKARPDMFVTRRCSKCWGCGEPVGEVVTVQANTGHRKTYRFARLLPTDQTAEREDRCTRCGGDAYTVPVTAKPTGSSKGSDQLAGSGSSTKTDAGGAAYTETEIVAGLNEDAMASEIDLAEALEDLDPEIATAAAALHSPEAERWATHRWGRSFVLWPHVPAGKVLAEEAAERSRLGSGHLVPVLDRLAAERDAEAKATRPDYRRRSLIAAAHRQARELHARVQEDLRRRGLAA